MLNVWVDDLTMKQLMARLDQGVVFTLNPQHLYHLQRNRAFYAAYRKADFITSDSKYVYWALGLDRQAHPGEGVRLRHRPDLLPPSPRQPRRQRLPARRGPGIAQKAREAINAREDARSSSAPTARR